MSNNITGSYPPTSITRDSYQEFRTGGTVYRRSHLPPEQAFKIGWRKPPNSDKNLLNHIVVDQGKKSGWVSTSRNFNACAMLDPSYGKYIYLIQLERNSEGSEKGIDVNSYWASKRVSKNPFASQQEIAIEQAIEPREVQAVWVPKEENQPPAPCALPELIPTQNYYDMRFRTDFILAY